MHDSSTPPMEPVTLEVSDGIATLTMERPRSINALSEEMLEALQVQLDDIASRRDIKVVILRGAGIILCGAQPQGNDRAAWR